MADGGQMKTGAGLERGLVGMFLGAGDVVSTTTGRLTTPFPRVDCSTGRRVTLSLARATAWLVDNAQAEAEARGDAFNGLLFKAMDRLRTSQADRDAAEHYLFDPAWNFPVGAGMLRPLAGAGQVAGC